MLLNRTGSLLLKSSLKITMLKSWFFTTMNTNLTIWLANLPLSIRVHSRQRCSRQRVTLLVTLWEKKHFLWCWYCGKRQIECGLVLPVLPSTTINASSQWSKFVVDSLSWAWWVHNILNTVMTHIIVDKSTDNAKPHLISLLSHSSMPIYHVQTRSHCDNLDFPCKM